MVASLLAAAGGADGSFRAPYLDYHALAPELVLIGVLVAVLVLDLFVGEDRKVLVTNLAGVGVLAALVPILTLAVDGSNRSMFGGAYVVDEFALVLKGLFLVTAYVVLLMSTNYIADGDYYEGEYSFLLLASLIGMTVMASSRDLLTIFVALETLSLPAYMLAGWRKRDLKSNEAALKYYLLGVLASGVMLYGMSLIFGYTGETTLTEIAGVLTQLESTPPLISIGILFIIVGFAFKVSAVPFHFWAPDTYEGAPTPITAFLSVASKAAGFVALLQLIYVGFIANSDVWGPLCWVLAALSMTVGNLIALRQTNVVRMLAYSSIAQAGYILVPFAVAGESAEALVTAQKASVVYLLIYAAMNLGAFAVVIAVARKTRSGEISSYGGLFKYAPGLTLLMSAFMFSLAGIPPLGGWFAKLYVFTAALDAGTPAAIVLAVIAGVNSVIALFYYASIAREMWMSPVPDGDVTPVTIPPALSMALAITAVITVAVGVYPPILTKLGNVAILALG
ncbi:MAG TPA: NADH-quinone oxidoreductase subunit N [Acidimicrobiales bacterium]|nr:NADH-quinone oxidoreductase subunit N [Acidimicrobiales bacterium]